MKVVESTKEPSKSVGYRVKRGPGLWVGLVDRGDFQKPLHNVIGVDVVRLCIEVGDQPMPKDGQRHSANMFWSDM